MRSIPRLGLTTLLCAFLVSMTISVIAATIPALLSVARSVTERQNSTVLRSYGEQVGGQVVRMLYAEWLKLQKLSNFATNAESQGILRVRFDTIKASNADCAWIGFADRAGNVVVASGGILEGNSVLQRPWFQAGAEGPYAGDKHEALLLAQYLGRSSSGEPFRLIDLALPVYGADKTLQGVIGMHIDWAWLRDLVRSSSRDDDSDLILISRAGDVLAGPKSLEGTRLTLDSARAAGQGASITTTETWPDGHRYLVSVVPIGSYRDLPSFGWTLLVRQPADIALEPARAIISTVAPIFGVVTVGSLLAALLIAKMVGNPLRRLAQVAGQMARGTFDEPVPEERAFREAALLSNALARLQSTVRDQAAPDSTKWDSGSAA